VRVLDFAHVAGYLGRAAQEAFGPGTGEPGAWLDRWLHELKHGDPDQVVAALAALPAGEARGEAARSLAARRDQLRYAEFWAAGYPIGSGCVASAGKRLAQGRLCQAGVRWAPGHVDALRALRTVVGTDRWAAGWGLIAARLRGQARRVRRARRTARLAAATPPPPALPPDPPPTPAATPAAPARPKLVVRGRPTADHPWKRPLLRQHRQPAPALPNPIP
jgi:hypothetical protein